MRTFIDPKISVYEAVISALAQGNVGALPDFSSTLVVVPGSLWGRQLQEVLLEKFPGGVCPPAILTPGRVLHFGRNDAPATPAEERLVWAQILDDPAAAQLLPRHDQFTAADYASAGRLFADLRGELVRGGRRIAEAARIIGDAMPEIEERWQALAKLEKKFEEKLGELGLNDPARLDQEAARDIAPLVRKFRQVIVAFVPGLPAPLRRKLALLEKEIPVSVLIQGDPGIADLVDDYGEPRAAAFAAKCLPVKPENIHACADLASAAQLAAKLATGGGKTAPDGSETSGGKIVFDPAETAIALGRPDFYFDFAENFSAAFDPRVELFSPDGIPVRYLRIGKGLQLLYTALTRVGKDDDYPAIAEFIRQEEFLRAFGEASVSFAEYCTLLDRFQVEFLPDRVEAALKMMQVEFAPLARLFTTALEQLRRLAAGDLLAELKSFLTALYGTADFPPTRQIALREEIRFWTTEIAALAASPVLKLLPAASAQLNYLLTSAEDAVLYPAHPEAATPVYNFLEVPALRQSRLILVGINSGVIPSVAGATPFLTDSIRRELGLNDSSRQTALESFKLFTLLQSGREVELIVLTHAPDDSPLRPSELFYLGGDEQRLLERVKRCGRVRLAEPAAAGDAEYRLSFPRLNQQKYFQRGKWVFSVTAFKDYLSNPELFILQKVYGIDLVDYEAREMSAADFGTVCHRGLEKMRDCPNRSRAELEKHFFAGAAEYLREKFGSPLPLLVELQSRQIEARLTAAAEFYAAEENPFTLLETEYRLGGGAGIEYQNFLLRGTIDRIELSPDRTTLRLVDIKTYSKDTVPEKDHWAGSGENLHLKNLQLPLYRILLELDAEFWRKHDLDPAQVKIEVGYLVLTATDDVKLNLWSSTEEKSFDHAVKLVAPTLDQIRGELEVCAADGNLVTDFNGKEYRGFAPLFLNGVEADTVEE